jgi:hypothetical protein
MYRGHLLSFYLLKAQKINCGRLQLDKGLFIYCLLITIIYCRPLFNASLNTESSALLSVIYCRLTPFITCYSLKILSTESYALDHVIYCSIVCLIIDPYFCFSI